MINYQKLIRRRLLFKTMKDEPHETAHAEKGYSFGQFKIGFFQEAM